MRVLHVNNQANFYGGVERILHDLAVTMSEQGEQGLLFTYGGSTSDFDMPFDWYGMCLKEALEDFRPDVALIHKLDDADLIARISAEVPTLVYVHDHDFTCPRRHKYILGSDQACTQKAGISCLSNLCFVERAPAENLIPVTLFEGMQRQRRQLAAVRQAHGLIVASESMRAELVQNGIPDKKVSVIPPVPRSIDDIHVHPATDQQNLLYVGQVIRGKGVDLLIRAMQKLPETVALTVVGAGNHLDTCQQLATELGLTHRIHFAGWVDHEALNAFYDAAQMLVVPSRWPEPFGMVGLEAMARGRPVVAFDTGGISDWLRDGETGLLAEPGNVSDLAQKVLMLVNDKHQRQRMSKQAIMAVRERFSHGRCIAALTRKLQETRDENSHLSMRHR